MAKKSYSYVISQSDAKKLLELSSELVSTLMNWGLHRKGELVTRDADTGLPSTYGSWAGSELETLICKLRERTFLDRDKMTGVNDD